MLRVASTSVKQLVSSSATVRTLESSSVVISQSSRTTPIPDVDVFSSVVVNQTRLREVDAELARMRADITHIGQVLTQTVTHSVVEKLQNEVAADVHDTIVTEMAHMQRNGLSAAMKHDDEDAVAGVFRELVSGAPDRCITCEIASTAILALRDLNPRSCFNDALHSAIFDFYSHFSRPQNTRQQRHALGRLASLVHKLQDVDDVLDEDGDEEVARGIHK